VSTHIEMRRYWQISFGLLTVFLALFVVVEVIGVPVLTDPTAWLGRGGLAAGLVAVGLLVGDVVLPVPSSIVMMANGALFGVVVGTMVSLVGSLGAAAFGFVIGRRNARLLERLVTPAEKAQADALLARWGAAALVVTRPIPLLAETVAILAGASPLGWGSLLGATTAGALPACLLYALTGASGQSVGSGALMFGIVLLVAGVLWWVGRRV
jgi:uncharacterized membrane protein YdjX (TVP38/TMEM64 family)